VYGRTDDSASAFAAVKDTPELSMDISTAKGCYEVYVTARVVNTQPVLESAPSNTIVVCVNLPCGEVGTDGTVGFCEGDIEVIAPVPSAPADLQLQ
jgi:hypothetical protein